MPSFYGGIGITNGSGGGGVSIANIDFDTNRNLIIYLSDGSKKNLGQIDGAVFTPSVDENGILTWHNDAGLENPPAFDLTAGTSDEGELWFSVDEVTEEDHIPATENSTEYLWEQI